MSSSRVAINRIVITGRAVTDPIKKTVTTHRGEATLSTFAIRTAKDTHVGSVIMENRIADGICLLDRGGYCPPLPGRK